MGDATGPVTEVVSVVYRAEGFDGLRRSAVSLIQDYTTREDIPRILATGLGIKADGITIYSMARI